MDTIFAVATPPGRAGVAVIRVSGPAVDRVCQRFKLGNTPLRKAVLHQIRDGDEVLDEALVIRFPEGASFTGEDVLEVHIHGSPAVRDVLLHRLGRVDGCRLAEPGEFTRRALENGRMGLTEVEGLAALLEADTEAQRKQAQRVYSGGLSGLGEAWRSKLIEALALLEVTIDFADEEVPVDVGPDVERLVTSVAKDLAREVEGVPFAERVREGFEVAIVGAPNAGKSTLLNALAGRQAALTSEVPGTTRDIVEVRMDIAGLPVTFLDTAGLRISDDQIETMGVDLAVARAATADLRVFLESDADIPDLVAGSAEDIYILGKCDLRGELLTGVSGLTGAGIDGLMTDVAKALGERAARVSTATHTRHRIAMEESMGALESSLKHMRHGSERVELASEEIRRAARSLDRMIGRVDVESILDHIFSRFCLGK